MNDKSWSVYIHTNKSNGKVYVGISANISRRWRGDGSEYLAKKSPFASAIKKYGWNGFSHDIIASNLTLSEANRMEQRLISEFKSNINRFGHRYGYNQTDGGDGTAGFPQNGEKNPFWNRHHSNETKERLSHANAGKFVKEKSAKYGIPLTIGQKEQISASLKLWYSQHKSSSCKSVLCISDGTWFSSVIMAAEHYKIPSNEISAVCLGKRLSAHGLKFTYSPDGTEPKYLREGKGRSEQAHMMRITKSIPVECVETGAIFESAKVAAEVVGIKSRGDIGKCCKGKAKTAGGFHWRYAEVNQYET